MVSRNYYASNITFVDESNSTYSAGDVQGLFDFLDVTIDIESDASDYEVEFAIKIEIDEYLENIERSDYQVYEFDYVEQ